MQHFFDIWVGKKSSPTYVFTQDEKDNYVDADDLRELEQSAIPEHTKVVIRTKVRPVVPNAPLPDEKIKMRRVAQPKHAAVRYDLVIALSSYNLCDERWNNSMYRGFGRAVHTFTPHHIQATAWRAQ